MEFTNGSFINNIKCDTSNVRSTRSELVSFYCAGCNAVHVGYPIKKVIILDEVNLACKESVQNIK